MQYTLREKHGLYYTVQLYSSHLLSTAKKVSESSHDMGRGGVTNIHPSLPLWGLKTTHAPSEKVSNVIVKTNPLERMIYHIVTVG